MRISYEKNKLLGRSKACTQVYNGRFYSEKGKFQKNVAVKVVSCDSEERSMLLVRKIQALLKLESYKFLCSYLWAESYQDKAFIALELCVTSLEAWIEKSLARSKNINEIEILSQTCKGIEYLHSKNIMHMNLKPSNLLFYDDGNKTLTVKVSDFGFPALKLEHSTSISDSSNDVNNSQWTCPEILRLIDAHDEYIESKAGTSIYTAAADIFSLGCIFYYTLTGGKHPFGNEIRRNFNILEGKHNIKRSDLTNAGFIQKDAVFIINSMVSSKSDCRPRIEDVIGSTFFWPEPKVEKFLAAVGECVALKNQSVDRCITRLYEKAIRTHVVPEKLTSGRSSHIVLKFGLTPQNTIKGILLECKKVTEKNTEDPQNQQGTDLLSGILEEFPSFLTLTWLSFRECKSPLLESLQNFTDFCMSEDDVLDSIFEVNNRHKKYLAKVHSHDLISWYPSTDAASYLTNGKLLALAPMKFCSSIVNHNASSSKIEQIEGFENVIEKAVCLGSLSNLKNFVRVNLYSMIERTNVITDWIHVVVENTKTQYPDQIKTRKEIIDFFLECDKSLIYQRNKKCQTPLHVPNVHLELLKYLIENGGSVTAKGPNDETCMHLVPAYLTSLEYHGLVEFIVKRQCEVVFSMRSNTGQSPLHNAVKYFDVKIETLQLLRDCGQLKLNWKDVDGRNVLMQAIVSGRSMNFLKILLEESPNVSHTDKYGMNILHLAVFFGHTDAIYEFANLRLSGRIINEKDKEGKTPLDYVYDSTLPISSEKQLEMRTFLINWSAKYRKKSPMRKHYLIASRIKLNSTSFEPTGREYAWDNPIKELPCSKRLKVAKDK